MLPESERLKNKGCDKNMTPNPIPAWNTENIRCENYTKCGDKFLEESIGCRACDLDYCYDCAKLYIV